ncbi:MAG: CRISPR-associated protein [Cyanobacteria bacterium SBC]|nr:CRISPR-associated protein [Cyanobacteria bacterium SBC]
MTRSNRSNREPEFPKPYEFVSFPRKPLQLKPPAGHHKYLEKRHHGTLHLELSVGTSLHVSTGTVMMGSDVGESRLPLIKTMMEGQDKKLIIPGSSLKGAIRSIYEAITNSTLGVVTNRYRNRMPKDRLPCRKKEQLCPASQVFGALDWQGLVSFRDAKCVKTGVTSGFMPSLYRPRPDQCQKYFDPVSRKFYYHADKAVKGGQRGIPVQQASQNYVFETQVQFKNLTLAELGTLLVALGQDEKYPFALKVGAGKPIGMGSMTVTVKQLEKPDSMRDRYLSYTAENKPLEGEELKQFKKQAIETARQTKLLELEQLEQLQRILEYPTTRKAPDGAY